MNNDITDILYRIKENLKAIESGDERSSLLDEVRSDYLDLVELIKLFLISERDTYYGYFLMNLQFSVNFHSNSIAGIKLNTFPPVFESNPLLLCKFTLKEIIYIVCHEIDHIVLNHPAEMVKANPTEDPEVFREFNLAADASVNDRINHEIDVEKHKFMSPPDGLITSSVLSEMFDLGKIWEMQSYAYYFNLIKDLDKDSQENRSEPSNGQESIMKEKIAEEGSGDLSVENQDGEQSDIVTAANCGGNISDHEWEAGSDAEDAAAAVRELVNASVSMMSDESRGMMPGYFLSQVENLNKPPVLSWQALLKKYIGTITAGKRKTRMRLDRRQPERFDIAGRVDDKILKIVVAIDTSGSMDDHMISSVFSEIFAILAKRKYEITVIECDARVQKVYRARNISEIEKKVAGRGGTCFTPVIEYINNDRYFRDALLIYFTDGYGESEIPKPKTYRNLWVVLDDSRNLSVKDPYGTVVTL